MWILNIYSCQTPESEILSISTFRFIALFFYNVNGYNVFGIFYVLST